MPTTRESVREPYQKVVFWLAQQTNFHFRSFLYGCDFYCLQNIKCFDSYASKTGHSQLMTVLSHLMTVSSRAAVCSVWARVCVITVTSVGSVLGTQARVWVVCLGCVFGAPLVCSLLCTRKCLFVSAHICLCVQRYRHVSQPKKQLPSWELQQQIWELETPNINVIGCQHILWGTRDVTCQMRPRVTPSSMCATLRDRTIGQNKMHKYDDSVVRKQPICSCLA